MMENDFQSHRTFLVNNLRKKGINDENVLRAIISVQRELFVSDSISELAYEDVALQIDCHQTISQPYTVAYMTQLLNLKTGTKVLEIGTGSGYQAAILAEMGADVYSIERIEELHTKSKVLLESIGYKIKCYCGDGTLGLPEFAPYDRIIVTAAAPGESQSLLNQLAPGGRMVIPIGKSDYQTMYVIEKLETGEIRKEATDTFRFVPLIGEEGWQK